MRVKSALIQVAPSYYYSFFVQSCLCDLVWIKNRFFLHFFPIGSRSNENSTLRLLFLLRSLEPRIFYYTQDEMMCKLCSLVPYKKHTLELHDFLLRLTTKWDKNVCFFVSLLHKKEKLIEVIILQSVLDKSLISKMNEWWWYIYNNAEERQGRMSWTVFYSITRHTCYKYISFLSVFSQTTQSTVHLFG